MPRLLRTSPSSQSWIFETFVPSPKVITDFLVFVDGQDGNKELGNPFTSCGGLLGAWIPDPGHTILYKKVRPRIWTSQIYSFLEGKKFKNELMIIFSGMSCRVGSIASSRQSGRSRSYRTKSKRSEVDESLFGSANSAAKLRANCRSNKPETVQGQ